MQISNKFTAFNCSRIWFNCSLNFRILFFRFWRVIFFILLILWRVVLFPELGMLSSFLTIDEMAFLYLLSSVFLKARAVYELIDFRNNFDNLVKKKYSFSISFYNNENNLLHEYFSDTGNLCRLWLPYGYITLSSFLYNIVIPVYKGQSREPENVAFMGSCL